MSKWYLTVESCDDCGKTFRTDSGETRLCRSCEKKRLEAAELDGRKKKQKRKPKQSYDIISIKRFVSLLDRYNERHNTRYTYGQAMAALVSGIIDSDEFKNG